MGRNKKQNSWVADPAIRCALAREIRCARLRREIWLKRMAKMRNAPEWMREMSRDEAQKLCLAEIQALYMAFEAADAAVAARVRGSVRGWTAHHAAQLSVRTVN